MVPQNGLWLILIPEPDSKNRVSDQCQIYNQRAWELPTVFIRSMVTLAFADKLIASIILIVQRLESRLQRNIEIPIHRSQQAG